MDWERRPWLKGVMIPMQAEETLFLRQAMIESLIDEPPKDVSLDQLATLHAARNAIKIVDDLLTRLANTQ